MCAKLTQNPRAQKKSSQPTSHSLIQQLAQKKNTQTKTEGKLISKKKQKKQKKTTKNNKLKKNRVKQPVT